MLNIVFHFACVLAGVVDLAVSNTKCFYSNNENDLSKTHGFLIGAFQIPYVLRLLFSEKSTPLKPFATFRKSRERTNH